MSHTSESVSNVASVFTVVLPWVRVGHTDKFIRDILTKSGLGDILDMKRSLKEGDSYDGFYEVTIGFNTFPNLELKEFLENAGVIKVFFNQKNFWKIRATVCPPRQDPKAPILVPHLEFPLRVHSVFPSPDE